MQDETYLLCFLLAWPASGLVGAVIYAVSDSMWRPSHWFDWVEAPILLMFAMMLGPVALCGAIGEVWCNRPSAKKARHARWAAEDKARREEDDLLYLQSYGTEGRQDTDYRAVFEAQMKRGRRWSI